MLSLLLVVRWLELRKSSLSKHHEKTNYKKIMKVVHPIYFLWYFLFLMGVTL